MTHGNGLQSNATYDLDGRLTQLQVKDGAILVQGRSFDYADGLNLTGITDQMTAANSNTLSYTPANRLASATGAWGTKTHSYDGVGNRITDPPSPRLRRTCNTVLSGTTTNRTQYYGAANNRLSSIYENGASLRSYTYDGNGNTLTETRPGDVFAYTYNKRNRLASVTVNAAAYGTYVYNALEQLVSRTSNAPAAPLGTFHYLYDLDGHLIAEADAATGATLREYIWLPANASVHRSLGEGGIMFAEAANDNSPVDLPLAVIDGVNTATPVTSHIHTDHLGRPTRMTSATKATVWQATWKPWGEIQSLSGTATNNLRFPGQYFQIETGLHYNHHRHYDPVTGRYTQPDPLGFVDGPSVYAYARSSPLMVTDREGLFAALPHSPIPNFNGTSQRCTKLGEPKLFHFAGTPRSGSPNSGSWVSGNTWRYFGSDGMALFDVDTTGHGGPHIQFWTPEGKRSKKRIPY
jgi:RHS repeat-associated protein